MPVLSAADKEARDLLDEVLREHHPDLAEAGVTINLLFANNEAEGPALKLHGYPCEATVKINSLKDRIEGKKDATIELDADVWHGFPEARKKGLLDHECTHLVLQREKHGAVKYDDAGRPKLKMRLHDGQVGVFFDVMRRHGRGSPDLEMCRDLHRELVQRELFPAE